VDDVLPRLVPVILPCDPEVVLADEQYSYMSGRYNKDAQHVIKGKKSPGR